MRSLRILLVDDSEFVQALVSAVIEERGHTAVVATGPLEIANLVAGAPPDVALVDVGFPGIDPDRLATILKADLAPVPYFVFSDRKEADLIALVEKLGARGFLPKKAGSSLVDSIEAACAGDG
ncbi:hypothetical protein AKJ09_06546 [Labilithrix luteola]|uniref:Response regulatory domain-containing protein n=1 Tax=Labilithrix luteola TaxID=1391654 RepID=A0A0K1Q2C4_9BACT|nr:response regulator [Labilithrix luteola]AKU99882.1 hypothetical protein AKJ09_06546 [Labilithrix luteola]